MTVAFDLKVFEEIKYNNDIYQHGFEEYLTKLVQFLFRMNFKRKKCPNPIKIPIFLTFRPDIPILVKSFKTF